MHKVTCKYCQQTFDRDKEPFVQISARRYAHKMCAEDHENNKTQEEKDQEALEAYIMKLLDEPYVNARVRKQIKYFQNEYNYTYSGMLKALIWWYEIKGHSTEQANGGIGILPYIYTQARDYYYHLYLAKIANEDKNFSSFKKRVKEINIESPTVYIKPHRLFKMEDDDD